VLLQALLLGLLLVLQLLGLGLQQRVLLLLGLRQVLLLLLGLRQVLLVLGLWQVLLLVCCCCWSRAV
jgi:hypothetical protein